MATNKKQKDIPIVKIALGAAILGGAYFGMKYLGIIGTATTKAKCVSKDLTVIDPLAPDRNLYPQDVQDKYKPYTFSPGSYAAVIHNCFSGFNMEGNACNAKLKIVKALSDNDLRCMHNYWNKSISSSESIYDFLDSQYPYPGTEEVVLIDKFLKRLISAGVGPGK